MKNNQKCLLAAALLFLPHFCPAQMKEITFILPTGNKVAATAIGEAAKDGLIASGVLSVEEKYNPAQSWEYQIWHLADGRAVTSSPPLEGAYLLFGAQKDLEALEGIWIHIVGKSLDSLAAVTTFEDPNPIFAQPHLKLLGLPDGRWGIYHFPGEGFYVYRSQPFYKVSTSLSVLEGYWEEEMEEVDLTNAHEANRLNKVLTKKILLPGGTFEATIIPYQQLEGTKRELGAVPDTVLRDMLGHSTVYRLRGDKVLFTSETDYINDIGLVMPEDVFRVFVQDKAIPENGAEDLVDIQVTHRKKLAGLLGCEVGKLDYSVKSLEILDNGFAGYLNTRLLSDKYYMYVKYYLLQVLANATGGELEAQPYIADPDMLELVPRPINDTGVRLSFMVVYPNGHETGLGNDFVNDYFGLFHFQRGKLTELVRTRINFTLFQLGRTERY
jgi:hypothetical protein